MKTMQIKDYALTLDEEQTISMQIGAHVVAVEGDSSDINVYAVSDMTLETESRSFLVAQVDTDTDFDDVGCDYSFVGMATVLGAVYAVFETCEK